MNSSVSRSAAKIAKLSTRAIQSCFTKNLLSLSVAPCMQQHRCFCEGERDKPDDENDCFGKETKSHKMEDGNDSNDNYNLNDVLDAFPICNSIPGTSMANIDQLTCAKCGIMHHERAKQIKQQELDKKQNAKMEQEKNNDGIVISLSHQWAHLIENNVFAWSISGFYEIKDENNNYEKNQTICDVCLQKLINENKVVPYLDVKCDYCSKKYQRMESTESAMSERGIGCSSWVAYSEQHKKTFIYCDWGSSYDCDRYEWISNEVTLPENCITVCDECIKRFQESNLIEFDRVYI